VRPANRCIEDDGDGTEREPETGPQDRPRIEQDDHTDRDAQHMRHAGDAARPECNRNDDQHVQRPLRRHAEARKQHIEKGHDRPRQRGRLLGGQKQWQAGAREEGTPPECKDKPGKHAGNHGDVQARYGNQMPDAGAIEHLPVGLCGL
jgi:hypothetical protein